MGRFLRYLFIGLFIVILWIVFYSTIASVNIFTENKPYNYDADNGHITITPVPVPDTTLSDTSHLHYNFNDESEYPASNMTNVQSPLFLHSPSNLTSTVEYDPVTNQYVFSQKIGKLIYRYPSSMSYDEYRKYEFDNSIQNYWRQKYSGESFEKQQSIIPQLYVGGDVFDRIFGSNVINIQPQGSAELIFGVNISKTANPSLPIKLQKTVTFDFQEKIQMNVTGQIGDKMKLQANYNTESTFDFENKMNLRYEGKEDEIIQIVEAGDVTLPLAGSLITGSQSLFGIKTELQFGKLRVTSVLSQQRGEPQVIEVQGGAQLNDYKVTCDNYEANKHFFLAQFFREHFDESLKGLPVINSGVTITKIEVWVTNKSGNFTESRNIVAFLDLAEGHVSQNGLYGNSNIFNDQIAVFNNTTDEYPRNDQNDLYEKMTTTFSAIRNINQVTTVLGGADFVSHDFLSGQDFEKVENARKLSPTEYTLNAKLGYVSLSSALNSDEVLAVAFEYTVRGKTYRVGEFSQDGPATPNSLFLKMLKGTYLSPKIIVQTTVKKSPTWELMMKNVYSIGAYQVNPDGFQLNVMYQNDKTGSAINYIPEGPKPEDGGINGKILIQVLNLDNLNSQLDPSPDGTFDYVEGVTINSSNGRIIFPVLQPFGKYMYDKITGGSTNNEIVEIAKKYAFQELYDSSQTWARSISEKNKFFLEGTYQSASSSEINLNATNIPQGSVKVTVGGNQLSEGQDYTVDYNLGRVKIINQGLLESGAQVKISLESNSLFAIQTKTLIGTHLDYKFNSDFHIGATILNLTERPLTSKVNIGDEPISNTIWGLDGSYRTDAPYITNFIDKLPFLDTKESSNITVNAEFAHLIPGHSKVLKKNGVSYIDDFEGTTTHNDMRQPGSWVLSSTPQYQPELFPEAALNNNRAYGYNRAKLAWYTIDQTAFLRNTYLTPSNIDANAQSSHFVREVFEKEIFPNKETPNGIPTSIQTLSLAFYPDEKGPYNYDLDTTAYSAGILKDGSGRLADPVTRWGGVMRKIDNTDFEAANYEFIEFWLLDPFCEDQDSANAGGKLYFNMGNISEDILKDSRKAFENGLPRSESDTVYIDSTAWGRVPLSQSLVDAFDNDPQSRTYQDIGLDGLSDQQEITFFSTYVAMLDSFHNIGVLNDSSYNVLYSDPSSDDFHYYLGGDYDNLGYGILQRYKKYNGLESNSPVGGTNTSYTAQSSISPDVEDINHDKTLSEGESYYQYEIPITYQNFLHDKKFITDEIQATVTLKNGQTTQVKWYQFKIPLYEPDKVVGSISDFKSIRFARMFLKGFEKDVVLRFATLDIVRGEWRKYVLSMKEGGEYTPSPQPGNATFDITAVNIEENGTRSPVNYVLPPGIDRVIDPTNPQMRQLNEQSMLLKVIDLADGDARAAYKNVTMDVRTYKRMQMEVHAEEIAGYPLEDNQLSVFIRLGSDYKQNFYEYEVPLKLTPPGLYNNDNNTDRQMVWPTDNRIDIYFDLLKQVKQLRNEVMESDGSISLTSHYSQAVDQNGNLLPYISGMTDSLKKITVCGNPNLSNVRTIMIGLRNPNDPDNDDPRSGIVWVNELRLTDFDEKGGWAANARVATKLADIGMLTISGSTSKPGFGSIEKKVSERSKEDIYQYDISSNLELGKFFPQKAGVKIPMYVSFSQTIKNPQYNPLDPDIPFEEALSKAPSDKARDSIKHVAQDFSQRKSINFTNVQITRGMKEKPSLFDISNLSLSYSYSEIYARNINTVYDINRNYRGALAYNFNTQSKNVMPFSKVKFLKSKSLSLIRDFNFYYLPQQISLRTDVERNYRATQLRNISNPDIVIYPSYKKDFTWNRMYDVRYDLSRGLKLDFSAANNARIDEPDGKVDKNDKESYQRWKDSVLTNVANFGRTTQYHHMFNANWNTPLNKLPFLDWTSLSTRYNCTYDWTAGPLERDSTGKLYNRLGNTIKNSNTLQLNGQITLTTIYNKIPFLKKLNQPTGQKGQGKGPKGPKGKDDKGKDAKPGAGKEGEEPDDSKYEHVAFEKANMEFKANTPRIIVHNLQTTDVQVTAIDSTGLKIVGQQKVIDENRVSYTFDKDYKKVKIIVNGRKKLREDYWMIVLKYTLKALIGIKNISLSYSQTNGTLLPGYMQRTKIFGIERDNNGIFAPGIPFVLGMQDRKFAEKAGNNGWLTMDSTLNSPYIMNASETWNFRSTIEPVEGMRIELNAQRTLSENRNEFYYPDADGKFRAGSSTTTGNFSMSFLAWPTSFEKIEDKTYWTNAFRDLLNYRIKIAERLCSERLKDDNQYTGATVDSTGFPDGYSPSSQQVLIPAFMAAYAGISPAKVTLETFPSVIHMMPNWRITYDGLSKIEWVKKYFKTISINHTYRCTYNIGNYSTSLLFTPDADGISRVRDVLDVNYLPKYEINSVTISEQFSPLIDFDMTWNNSLTTKVEFKKTRNLTLTLSNNQVTEVRSDEYVIGAGYRIKDLKFNLYVAGKTNQFKSDLILKFDFSVRSNMTVMHQILEGQTPTVITGQTQNLNSNRNQLTSGQRIYSIKTSADYTLSDRFNLKFFVDTNITKPYIALSFPTTNTNIGFSVRFTLTN